MSMFIGKSSHVFKTVDGQFTSGMKKPDGGNSIDGYYIKFQFEKIDKDGDNVLSDMEILNRRDEEINQMKRNLAFKKAALTRLQKSGDTESAKIFEADVENLELQITTEETQSELYRMQMEEDKKTKQAQMENFDSWS